MQTEAEKRDRHITYLRERYQFLRDRKICVRCGSARVELDKAHCSACLEKKTAQNRKWRSDPNNVKLANAYQREKRRQRREAGLCPECGKEPYPGHVQCYECMLYNRRMHRKHYQPRERTSIPIPPPPCKPRADHPWMQDNKIVFRRRGNDTSNVKRNREEEP